MLEPTQKLHSEDVSHPAPHPTDTTPIGPPLITLVVETTPMVMTTVTMMGQRMIFPEILITIHLMTIRLMMIIQTNNQTIPTMMYKTI